MKEVYLVTGAAGHLGSAIIKELKKMNKKVRGLILQGEKNIPEDIDIFYGDVTNKESLNGFFESSDSQLIVIHCAGIISIKSKYSEKMYEVNVNGTKNIVELCKKYKAKKLVYVSSVHAIPEKPKGVTISETKDFDPDKVEGNYAKTKAEATKYVLEASKDFDISIVHPSGICGPYDFGRGHVTALVKDYYNGKLVAGTKGGYDFVDVRDVAKGILSCVERGRQGECYILANKYFTVREILNLLYDITGKKKIKSFIPLWFIKIMAPVAEFYYKILKQPPLYTPYSIYTLNSNSIFSNEKAKTELGYSTRDMNETLTDTVKWLKEKNII
ncbi:MAG: NAD-dependent epimerase/dehydratase family protein [Thermotogota bacterium]